MRVLVAYADDDGASADTARLIGDTLARHGVQSVVRPVDTADAEEFDAVVLGSTARAGHWLRRAVRFALTQRRRLYGVPVWLFSNSAPDGLLVPEHGIGIGPVEEAVEPLDHRWFVAPAAPAGPWTPHGLEPDPDEVCAWAHQIALRLQAQGDVRS